MDCPRCETPTLDERERAGVLIDVCLTCRGIWLDRGELEKLIHAASASEAASRGDQAERERDRDRDREHGHGHDHDDDRRWRRDRDDHDDEFRGHRGSEDGPRYADPRTRKRGWLDSLSNLLD